MSVIELDLSESIELEIILEEELTRITARRLHAIENNWEQEFVRLLSNDVALYKGLLAKVTAWRVA
jgi:hypothetical protein